MKFVQTSVEYERYVRDIQQTLLSAQKLETVQAVHNIELEGNTGQPHQVDVYWEYRLAGITHRVALECKLRGRKVDLGIVRDFWGVVDDVPGLRGVIVSPVGFTSGAIRYARKKGIGLKVVRPANEKDYEGRIRAIVVNFRFKQAVNLQLQTNIDTVWYEENKTPQLEEFVASMSTGKTICTDRIIIEDRGSGEVIMLAELQNYIPVLEVENLSGIHTWMKTFNDGYIVYPGSYELKLVSLRVRYEIQQLEHSTIVGGEEVAHVLVQDALAGTLLFVDEQGLISGDTEKEGISKPRLQT